MLNRIAAISAQLLFTLYCFQLFKDYRIHQNLIVRCTWRCNLTATIAVLIALLLIFWFHISQRTAKLREKINYSLVSSKAISVTVFLVTPFSVIFSEMMKTSEVSLTVKYFVVLFAELAFAILIDAIVDLFKRIRGSTKTEEN